MLLVLIVWQMRSRKSLISSRLSEGEFSIMKSYISFDTGKTLEDLEGRVEEKSIFESHVIRSCEALRKKRLCYFNEEDLRIMILQQQSLEYLVPMALEILEQNLLAKGDYYHGDLLEAVINVPRAFWVEHPIHREDLRGLIKEKMDYFKELLDNI